MGQATFVLLLTSTLIFGVVEVASAFLEALIFLFIQIGFFCSLGLYNDTHRTNSGISSCRMCWCLRTAFLRGFLLGPKDFSEEIGGEVKMNLSRQYLFLGLGSFMD